MRKEDRMMFKNLLDEGKLVVLHCDYNLKRAIIYGSKDIEYDSWNGNVFQKTYSVDNSDLKSIRIIKELFPTVSKVFAYYTSYDSSYVYKNEIEADGWKEVDSYESRLTFNSPLEKHPMYECSCNFIFAIPKNCKIYSLNGKVVDGIEVSA